MPSKEKGKLHICSRSLIFEPDDPALSITKYFYKYMTARPSKGDQYYDLFFFIFIFFKLK